MIDFILPFHLKAVLAARADDIVLSLGAGQTKHSATVRTCAVNVRLSVADLVFAKTEETAKTFVFPTALGDIAREHSVKDQNEERDRYHVVEKREGKLRLYHCGRDEERADKVRENDEKIHAEQDVV